MSHDLDARGWKAKAERAEAENARLRKEVDRTMSDAHRINELIASIGLDAPVIGEPNPDAWAKILYAFERLIDVYVAAKEYKSLDDTHGETGKPVEGHYKAWLALGSALNAVTP